MNAKPPIGDSMQTFEKVKAYVVDNFLFGVNGTLQEDTPFLENGIIDSTGVLELVGFLESEFGIRVADDEIVPENLNSLQNITRYLDRKLLSTLQPD